MKVERELDLVSVIISNYNNEKFIEECLNSIISQTYRNIELIIIDDNSTDDSINVIENWIEKRGDLVLGKDKIIFLKLPRNTGFSGAVTTGLYLAKGEFIAMQDGDDISDKNRILKQVQYLKLHKEINTVGSNYYNFNTNNYSDRSLSSCILYGKENVTRSFYDGKNPVSYGTIMFRGDIFDRIGGLTRKLEGAEDYEFLTKLLPYEIDNINEGLYFYRNHENQRSIEFYAKKKVDIAVKKEDLSILMVLDSFNIGGTETYVLWIAQEMIRRGIKVCILAGKGELEGEFRKLNCRVYNLSMPKIVVKDINTINEYKKKVEQIIEIEKINMVHLHQSPSGSLLIQAIKNTDIPIIFTIHGMYYHDIVSTDLKFCKKIISVSMPVFNWLLSFGLESKVIPNGVSYDLFNKNLDNELTRAQLGIGKNEKVIMYCSRMAWGKIKTCENVIRVCRDLSRGCNEYIHAIIVGDGPGYEELKKVGERANATIGKEIIHFVGGQAEVAKYYDASNIIVGTGRVAIEGFASKKPVIATGNNGYFGIVTKENLDLAWEMYFGDHDSLKDNNAMYLYKDMKNLIYGEEKYDYIDDVYEKSRDIFEIKNITDRIVELYLDAWK